MTLVSNPKSGRSRKQYLKIAHINNIAGVPITIANQQKRVGHSSDVYVFNKIAYKLFGGNKVNYRSLISRWKFFKKLKDYDLWHYHYPFGSLKRNLERRNKDKIYLKHYHGVDLQQVGGEEGPCLVATPDLLSHAPNGKWLPTALDLDYYTKYRVYFYSRNGGRMYHRTKQEVPIVIHYPAYKFQPTVPDYYSRVLKQLENEGKCKVITTTKFTYDILMQKMVNSDIIVGKIRPDMGWFGKFELEGMALGKPVIAYISDELYQRYKPPIYRTTAGNFKKDLENLLEDVSERQRLSNAGLEYVQNHSVNKVEAQLQEYYDFMSRYC
jgi:hypothetical protein